MEKTENIKVEAEVDEPKADFTEDPDEAWLDDLVIHLNAMEGWNYKKNASKVLMEEPMPKMPSQESHWNQIVISYPSFLCQGVFGTKNYNSTEFKMDVPSQENAEPGAAGLDEKEAEMEALSKNAGTQTNVKTTRDAAVQVIMKTPPKGYTLSEKLLANCK